MDFMSLISTALGAFSILSLICLVAVAILFIIDCLDTIKNSKDEIREHLEKEREYYRMLGIILYWATEAANELELDPPAREDILEAIDTFDDLLIEDRINFI